MVREVVFLLNDVWLLVNFLIFLQLMFWIMFQFNYFDCNVIVFVRLNDFEEDFNFIDIGMQEDCYSEGCFINLVNLEYQICVSIFFVGYIFG